MKTIKTISQILTLFALLNLSFADEGSLQFAYTFENKSIGQLVDEFNAETKSNINRLFIPQGDLKIMLLESIETETEPDMVLVPADHIGLYRPMQYSEINPENYLANIHQDVWNTAFVDNKYFGAPVIRGNHLMLFYNRKYVKEPAINWQSLFAQHAELQDSGVQTIAWNYNEMYFFVPFLGAYGGWPVTNGQLTLNSPAMVDALKSYRSLRDEGLVDATCDYDCAMQNFMLGKLAYTINGDWALKEFQEALGDNLGVALLPAWENRPLIPMFSTHVIAFPGNSFETDARPHMKRFVDFMQSYEVQKQLWEQIKVFPVEQQAYDEAINNIDPALIGILTQLEQAKAMPSDRAMSYAWGAMSKAYSRYMNDVISAEDAAELMQKLAERELSKDP